MLAACSLFAIRRSLSPEHGGGVRAPEPAPLHTHAVLGRWLSRCPAPPHPQAAPLNMSWALVEYGSASNPHHIGLLTAFQIVPPEFLLAGSSSHQAAI